MKVPDLLRWQYYVLVLFFAMLASISTVVQSMRTTPLVDYAYQIENAYRIYRGEMPYRDFFLVLPPGTYVLTALSMVVTRGYSHLGHMILVILQTFAGVVITGYILDRLSKDSLLNLILLALTLVTGHVIYPWASYDLDATLFILASFAFWLYVFDKHTHPATLVVLGIVFSLPTYFKQNIGFVYAFSVLLVYAMVAIRLRKWEIVVQAGGILLGMVCSYGMFLIWLLASGSIESFVYQAFIFPGNMKQPLVAVGNIIGAYREYVDLLIKNGYVLLILIFPFLLKSMYGLILQRKPEVATTFYTAIGRWCRIWGIGVSGVVVLLLLYHTIVLPPDKFFYYPFLLSWISVYWLLGLTMIVYFLRARSQKELFYSLFPVTFVASCHATYLSHHMVNASYGIWSLFIVMMLPVVTAIRKILPEIPVRALMFAFVLYMVVLLVRYNSSLGFFGSIRLDGTRSIGSMSGLQGLSTQGSWIVDMERMITYSEEHIPKTEKVAFFPGEDLFFSVTGRKNPMPFVQFQMGTYPMFEHVNLVQGMVENNIEWVIVKQEHQLLPGFGFVDITDPLFRLTESYRMVHTLPRYSIWKRIRS